MSSKSAFGFGLLAAAALAAGLVAAGVLAIPALAAHHLPNCANDVETCILEAIDELEPGVAGQWTKGGKPKVAAIEAITGIDISARDRDGAWEKFAAWKAERAELERLESELATMRAERDAQADEVLRVQERADALEVELARAERAIRDANKSARDASRRAARAETALESATTKLAEMGAGVPVCAAERAVVKADKSWTAKGLRSKTDELIACLEVGE